VSRYLRKYFGGQESDAEKNIVLEDRGYYVELEGNDKVHKPTELAETDLNIKMEARGDPINAGLVGCVLAPPALPQNPFPADYWYTTDKPARKGTISDVQKQFICNYIDRINVPFCVFFQISIACFQMYFQGLVVTMPCIFAAFGFAVFTQKWSLQQVKKFLDIAYVWKYDRENPDEKAIAHLKWGLYWHIIWHILASGLSFSQIYLLLCIPPCH